MRDFENGLNKTTHAPHTEKLLRRQDEERAYMKKSEFSKVKVLLVDMDNTLCDTLHTLSKPQWNHVIEAFERRGEKRYSDVLRKEFGKQGFVKTLEKLKMNAKDRKFAVREYDDVDVSKLKLFDDARAILDLKFPKILVTRGEPGLQKKKIAKLKIKRHFKEIRYVPTFEDKKLTFERVMKEHKLKPEECLVIGDRIEEEILDAHKLGMPSVLVRRPDWRIKRIVKPSLTVRSLYDAVKYLHVKKSDIQ